MARPGVTETVPVFVQLVVVVDELEDGDVTVGIVGTFEGLIA